MEEPEIPDLVKCPYCGAANSPEGEFCGACHKNLRLPPELRAAAKARRLLRGAQAAVPEAASAAETRPAYRFWARAVLISGLFLYYSQWLRDRDHYSLLDFVNLSFHEAGHLFLGFFGRFIAMLGGTIFQLLLPALCLLHLRRRGANVGWQLCLFWLGENLLNVSRYAADAVSQQLPLVGGGEHDWTYLLTETRLIGHTAGVARAIFLLGSAVIFYSFWLIGRDAAAREPLEIGDTRLC